MRTLLVTGSSGLIGSEVVAHFAGQGWKVFGIDGNQRADFFGSEGDTRWNQKRLLELYPSFTHIELDIRDRVGLAKVVDEIRPELIVHAAAQPSHDLAASRPFDDFDTNASGTLNLLEATRRHAPNATFVHMSTNKVYGDRPNTIRMRELATRWEYDDPAHEKGVGEDFPIDQSKHSLFGASKLAADIMVQEYGRYFGMKTCCLRGGCLTGPNHSGVQLHGFLSYLVRCNLEGRPYTVFGYKGKQVRDNIHAADVARFIEMFHAAPRSGEVYNIGGGKENAVSILEAFEIVEGITGKKMLWTYDERNREGDHVCYYTNLGKIKKHFQDWSIEKSLKDILSETAAVWGHRL